MCKRTKQEICLVGSGKFVCFVMQPVLAFTARKSFAFIQDSSICLYSAYISPNCDRDSYQSQIDELFAHTRLTMAATKLPVVMCGDFNAKNRLWGGPLTDTRGKILFGAASALGLSALNDGAHPTLTRVNGQSFIDLTFVSQEFAGADWRVLHGEESLSDHHFVLTEIEIRGKHQRMLKSALRADSAIFIKNLKKAAD